MARVRGSPFVRALSRRRMLIDPEAVGQGEVPQRLRRSMMGGEQQIAGEDVANADVGHQVVVVHVLP